MDSVIQNKDGVVYQVKWDGVRMLSFVEKRQVILQNRRGRIKTGTFPEMGCLAEISHQPLILDGEIVVVKDGRPDFNMILRRNFTSSPRPGAPPVNYVVFDVLLWQGKDVRGRPLMERQEMLAATTVPQSSVTIIDNFQDGEELFKVTAQRGWEGIVAKDTDSPYVPGKSTYWRKYKNKQTGLFYIVGYISKQGQLASLLIAKDFGAGLVLTGSVGSGLSNAGRKVLKQILSGAARREPPVPIKRSQEDWIWVEPLLQAEVVFLEWTDALTLRAPVFKGLFLEGKKFELP